MSKTPQKPIPGEIEASLLPLAGSIGEKYLKKRGLADAAPLLQGVSQPQDEGHSRVLWIGDVAFCPRFYGHPALVFALRDFHGAIVSLHGRYIEHNQPKSRTVGLKKYAAWASPNAWNTNYVPAIILTEAPLDALSLAVAGFPAVALCGTSAPEWLHRRCAFASVILAFDADEAGDAMSLKLQAQLTCFGARCARLRPQGGKDWNEVLCTWRRERLSDWLALHVLTNT